MPATALGVDRFPDLLPLRSSSGSQTGLFSDRGSWLGLMWGKEHLLDIRDLATGAIHSLELGSPLKQARSFPDRQEFTLLDGRAFRLGFVDADHFLLEQLADDAPAAQDDTHPTPRVECGLPTRILAQQEHDPWRALIGRAPERCEPPPAKLFEQNRARWNEHFARAFDGSNRPDEPTSQVLLARAVTTLLWNLRGPLDSLPHSGVIPSPFAYPGYWAWDSWKHAHALAHFAPELAAEQLRAQFCRQQRDGMVPDTVMPVADDDNWQNTKPPLAAWALDFLARRTDDLAVARELYEPCAAQMQWFLHARRKKGETLFRAGGVDHLTATWDTGWDECARFTKVGLEQHGAWSLFDLWQPDYNGWILNELHALANLADRLGETATDWRGHAHELAAAMRRALWNEARGCFCDVRASDGTSNGIRSAAAWLPVWAGAADAHQTARVRELLVSPNHFGTPMPFPVLAASEAAFDPDGYWNGAVWADHAALAFHVLGDSGIRERARLRDAIAQRDSLYECYSPLDGQPARGRRPAVAQFSWTAAAGIEVLHGGPTPAHALSSG